MTLKIVPFEAGVIKDDTAYSSEGFALDSEKIRWVRGKCQWLGGWELVTNDRFTGICRGIHSWTDNNGIVQIALGTSDSLWSEGAGAMFNITPFRATGTFGNNPFTTTSGSAVISVSASANGSLTGDSVLIAGSAAVGGITPGGPAGSYAASPFTTTVGSETVVVTQVAHSMASGDGVTIAGGSAVGGITLAGFYQIYVISPDVYFVQHSSPATSSATGGGTPTYSYWRAYVITVVDANTYTVTHIAAASSSATGGGNAATFKYRLNVGLTDGVGAFGYGTGLYGTGPYGTSIAPSAAVQARTWSLANFGEDLIANPLGGSIYQWELNFSQPAAILSNAPVQCLVSLVTPERFVMACGCTALGSDFNPMLVRWSDIEDANDWVPATDNLAGNLLLAEGSTIVGAKATKGGILIWTDTALYFITYTADVDSVYQAQLLGTGCGLLGPNAGIDHDGSAFWVTPANQFYVYTGGAPRPLVCPMRQYFSDNLAPAQGYKVFVAFDSAYTGVYYFYPAIDTNENTSYIRFDPLETAADSRAGWSNGTWDRTAWIDRGVVPRPLATAATGYLYYQDQGTGDNGNPVSRSIRWAGIDLSTKDEDGQRVLNLRRVVMDADTSAGFFFELSFWRWYNGTETVKGPYTWMTDTQYKDILAQGRLMGLYIYTTGAGDSLRLGDLRFDLSPGPPR